MAIETVCIYGSAAPETYTTEYASMSAMETGEDGDRATAESALVVEIGAFGGNCNAADTTNTIFNGWTTNATYDITITALDDGARNTYGDGKWSTTSYRLDVAVNNDSLLINNTNRIDLNLNYVQLGKNTNTKRCLAVSGCGAGSILNVVGCHLRTTADIGCFVNSDADLTALFVNSIGENTIGTLTDGFSTNGTVSCYNLTLMGFGNGFKDNGGTTKAINCAAFNNSDDSNFDTNDYCATDDIDEGTNKVDISPVGDGGEAISWAKVFTDYANGDFRVKDTDSYIYLASAVSQFDDANVPAVDIAGNARNVGEGESVCIGAFEYVAAGGLSIPVAMHHYQFNLGR